MLTVLQHVITIGNGFVGWKSCWSLEKIFQWGNLGLCGCDIIRSTFWNLSRLIKTPKIRLQLSVSCSCETVAYSQHWESAKSKNNLSMFHTNSWTGQNFVHVFFGKAVYVSILLIRKKAFQNSEWWSCPFCSHFLACYSRHITSSKCYSVTITFSKVSVTHLYCGTYY